MDTLTLLTSSFGSEPVAVADITDEEPDPGVISPDLPHVVLLELISGEDNHALWVSGLQDLLEECLAE